MTKFSNKSKKFQFGPFLVQFPDFWGKMFFFQKFSTLTCTISYGFQTKCKNLEKTDDQILKRSLDRQTDNQTLFHDTLLTTIRGPTNQYF